MSRIKKHESRDLDLIPMINLFMILVITTLSMATFERLGLLELNLPERSNVVAPNEEPDPGLLNLTVIITDKYLNLGASGGFEPNIFYQEEVEYRSKSDNHTFRRLWIPGEVVKSPSDGKVMSIYEKESILLNVVIKKDSLDPGTFVMVAHDEKGMPMMDANGEWLTVVPNTGDTYSLLGEEPKIMEASVRSYCKIDKLSAYYEMGRKLEKIHKLYSNLETVPPDVDDLVILASSNIIYDKVIQMMDICKASGYAKVALSLMGGS